MVAELVAADWEEAAAFAECWVDSQAREEELW